jgi:hypothetical protein
MPHGYVFGGTTIKRDYRVNDQAMGGYGPCEQALQAEYHYRLAVAHENHRVKH